MKLWLETASSGPCENQWKHKWLVLGFEKQFLMTCTSLGIVLLTVCSVKRSTAWRCEWCQLGIFTIHSLWERVKTSLREPHVCHWHHCVCSVIVNILRVCVESLVDCAWPAERVCISVQCAHKDTDREKICVETTRVWDPAVPAEAFPLNCVPLCKRQCQFWTRADDLRKQPVATSALGPPYVVCMNNKHTYTPRNHQRTHTWGHNPRRHAL